MVMKKVQPPVYFFLALLLMTALHLLLPLNALISFPWNLAGLVPVGIGASLNILADRSFKFHITTVKSFQKSSVLVRDSVFKYSRNPMYLGMILILVGIAIVMGSVTPWIIVPLFVVLIDRIFIQPEELMLEETFGSAFQAYRKRVRRWI